MPATPDILRKFYDMGLQLIPVNPQTKQPHEKYGQWKEKCMDFPTLSGIAAEHPEANWAVYCVGGIVGLDFDCPRTYEEHFGNLDTLTTKSPSGGYHPILKSLVPAKAFESIGVEVKVSELITVIGKGYEIVKDLPIKEVPDVTEFVKKSLPKFKAPKKKDASLLKNIKISDVVARYCKRIDGGHNYWRAYCPFHGDDKTPHLYIFENSNQWHCFKCRKHGFAVGFVMEMENLEYGEALQKIEELLGISFKKETEKYNKSQASDLVKYVENENVELFHDDVQEPYARIKLNGHWEIFATKDRRFKRWLTEQYYNETGGIPNNDAIIGALNIVEAKACFRGKQYILHNRVCWHNGAIWYDLGTWEAVKITAEGWEIIEEPPILFRRYQHQKPHDKSQISRNGSVKKILNFINLSDAGEQILFLVHTVSCFIPDIPHTIPAVYGQKGAAKSTLLKVDKELIDPSTVKILSFPRDNMELVQMLAHHYFAPFDNVTYLSDWQSDALCRASTGEGISKRALYTDDEDIIYTFVRCVALNGINLAVTKPDLLDRCILLQMDPFPRGKRKTERKFWQEFAKVKGEILGGIFTALSKAMKIYPLIKLDELPRMADFCEWGYAITGALDYNPETFLKAYYENIKVQNREAIESSPIGDIVLKFMEATAKWEGTSSELLNALVGLAESLKISTKSKGWPKSANTLSKRLNDIKANLLEEGIVFERSREENKRAIILHRVRENIVSTVRPSESRSANDIKNDDAVKTDCQDIGTISSGSNNNLNNPDDIIRNPDDTKFEASSSQKRDAETNPDGHDDNDDVFRILIEVQKAAKEWEQRQKESITQANIAKATFSLKPQFPSISADDLIRLLRKYVKIPQPSDSGNPPEPQTEHKPVTTVQIAGKEIPVVWEE